MLLTLSNGKTAGLLEVEESSEYVAFSKDTELGYLASGWFLFIYLLKLIIYRC